MSSAGQSDDERHRLRFDVKRIPDPAGDRVVTLDGKFLPYQW